MSNESVRLRITTAALLGEQVVIKEGDIVRPHSAEECLKYDGPHEPGFVAHAMSYLCGRICRVVKTDHAINRPQFLQLKPIDGDRCYYWWAPQWVQLLEDE